MDFSRRDFFNIAVSGMTVSSLMAKRVYSAKTRKTLYFEIPIEPFTLQPGETKPIVFTHTAKKAHKLLNVKFVAKFSEEETIHVNDPSIDGQQEHNIYLLPRDSMQYNIQAENCNNFPVTIESCGLRVTIVETL